MIPATNTKLLVSEDWKKIYQSFRSADFKSYDFETLRRTMISYLRENYPEEFNDFIDSSEYIALIDLIAYLGQNLSFRVDLNARENFLETAQRRDSILRLAQLISYNPARNTPASGFLKLTAISTSDNVYDSNGVNLANTTIGWNDATNPDWYQQFINIMNSAMNSNFGNPSDRQTISGIATEQYKISSANIDVPIFNFSKNINGIPMSFEIVPCTFSGKDYVYEQPPAPAQQFSIIYKNDNQGSGSADTGFFTHFKQGSISLARFSLDNPVPNEIVGVNTPDINNTDVWVWQLDNNDNFDTLWTQVPSVIGNNVIYNSLNKNLRTIYAVTSRDNDQIDLNFADGVFGDLPKGNFRLFYRQSNGLTYVIKPEQMSGVVIEVPYTNASGRTHTLQLTMSLQYTVSNASGPESNASIQLKAPQSYYTQNRMITGEDYNITPLTAGTDILKIKSVNRISSGLSKYFDLSDVSGSYSRTNIFANDGILYQEERDEFSELEFTSRNQVLAFIKNSLAPMISATSMRSFYFEKYNNPNLELLSLTWTEVNRTPGQSRGYISNALGIQSVGSYAEENLQYFQVGSLIKFNPPTGKYFDQKNNLKTIPSGGIPQGGRSYIWSRVQQVIGDGSNSGIGKLEDGTGPIIFSSIVPTGAIPVEIIPRYIDVLKFSIENEVANICMTQRNFGLTIDSISRTWDIITNSNLNITDSFSLVNQNNYEDIGIDSSWLVAFVWTGKSYQVRYRVLDYIFESEKETAFFIDETAINYDFTNNTVIKDKIDVLSINTSLNSNLGVDQSWQIDGPVVEYDGYIQPKKVKISFYDYNDVGQIIDPESFNNIVQPLSTSTETTFRENFVYFKKSADGQRYSLADRDEFIAYPTEDKVIDENKIDTQKFYFYDPSINVVKYWSTVTSSLVYTDEYFARTGRSDLKFHYIHNSGKERRIDPSKSNIIDIYVLTLNYDNDFRNWASGTLSKEPLAPTSQELEQNYGETLKLKKAISDEIVFHPVKYKILFGDNAPVNLRAKFKAVRNSSKSTTDNDLKTRILSAINSFFALENWDFGQSFYFSELSTYVMNQLTPDLTNFIIVPKGNAPFGSYFEVACLSNELFISGATVSDIEIIDAVTASQLKTSSTIITTTGI
jgi:hypothetical protein